MVAHGTKNEQWECMPKHLIDIAINAKNTEMTKVLLPYFQVPVTTHELDQIAVGSSYSMLKYKYTIKAILYFSNSGINWCTDKWLVDLVNELGISKLNLNFMNCIIV